MSSKHRIIWLTPPVYGSKEERIETEDILANTVMVRAVF